jgi:hypothetical protein
MRILAASVVLGLLAGCGSGSGQTQVQLDCNTFVNSYYCPKVVTCEPPGTVTQAECVSAVNSALDCSTVRAENGQFVTCKSDITAQDCSAFLSTDGSIHLPASCAGVFLM